MKQKFFIIKDDNEKTITIREYAELDRDDMSPICEEIYDSKAIQSAIKEGKEALISAIRTNNLYPLGIYAEKIAEAITELYTKKDKSSAELFFNDVDMLQDEKKIAGVNIEPEGEGDHIDGLLDDEFEDDAEKKDILDKIDPPLQKGVSVRVHGDDED